MTLPTFPWLYVEHGPRSLHVWFGPAGVHIYWPDVWRSRGAWCARWRG